jgi:hypothetical protein
MRYDVTQGVKPEPKEPSAMSDDEETTPAVARNVTGGSGGARARRLTRQAQELLDRTRRAADSGLNAVKARAREQDRVGEATHRALELASGGLGAAGRALSKLGDAARPASRGSSPAARSQRSEKGGRKAT